MIRRLFWLTLGAAAGVTGYRRLGRLVRAFRPLPGAGRDGRAPGGAGRRPGGYRGLAAFARDVREGMDQYTSQRAGPAGSTLEGQQTLAQRPSQAAARSYPGPDYPKDGR